MLGISSDIKTQLIGCNTSAKKENNFYLKLNYNFLFIKTIDKKSNIKNFKNSLKKIISQLK